MNPYKSSILGTPLYGNLHIQYVMATFSGSQEKPIDTRNRSECGLRILRSLGAATISWSWKCLYWDSRTHYANWIALTASTGLPSASRKDRRTPNAAQDAQDDSQNSEAKLEVYKDGKDKTRSCSEMPQMDKHDSSKKMQTCINMHEESHKHVAKAMPSSDYVESCGCTGCDRFETLPSSNIWHHLSTPRWLTIASESIINSQVAATLGKNTGFQCSKIYNMCVSYCMYTYIYIYIIYIQYILAYTVYAHILLVFLKKPSSPQADALWRPGGFVFGVVCLETRNKTNVTWLTV